jgi:hypothetical protein
MKKSVKSIVNVIWYVVVFEIIQMVVAFFVGIAWGMFDGKGFQDALTGVRDQIMNNSKTIIVVYIIANLLVILLFAWLKWTPFKRTYLKSKPWAVLFWVVLMVFGTIIPSLWLQEQLGVEMSDSFKETLSQLMGSSFGYIAVGILAPLAEEVVFRGAILRTLLGLFEQRWHWIAILISALIFGAVHGNLPQFIHATIIGLLIGWMYYRTKSIIPGVVFHWVNNTIAYVMYHLMPGMRDASLVDIFKGSQTNVYLALAFSFCIFFPALFQLFLRLKEKD